MKNTLYIFFLILSTSIFAQDITGPWNGLLTFPGGQLRITINITKADAGYSATMDSPDQGAVAIPVTSISFTNNELVFAIPAGKIEYRGTYDKSGFKGTFTQNAYPIPLDLARDVVTVKKPLRPQEPKTPFAYYTEEVTFKNEKNNIIFSGTLTRPAKEGIYPAVVVVSGSGPQNRDEELMDHKPFLVLADHLTKNGIAVLRYDDRGVEKSGGKFETATSADFANDAEAAFNYLKTRKDINKKKIGIAGHSEGGMIAPMVAAKNPDVAFIVMMAGTGIAGDELMMLQNYLIGKAGGMPEEELTRLAGINKKAYDIVKQEPDESAIKEKLTAMFDIELKPLLHTKGIPQSQINSYAAMQVEEISSPWFVYFLKYNPATVLEKVKCPVLAINGEKDLQVAPMANLDAIKRATDKSGNKKVTVKQLPGLNHLFQESATGSPADYATIEQTFSPIALNEITGWIVKQVK